MRVGELREIIDSVRASCSVRNTTYAIRFSKGDAYEVAVYDRFVKAHRYEDGNRMEYSFDADRWY